MSTSVGVSPDVQRDAFSLDHKSIHCEFHGDYESRGRDAFGIWIGTKCPECSALRRMEEADRADVVKAERFSRLVEEIRREAGIPPRFQSRVFDNYSPTCEMASAVKRVLCSYAEHFLDRLEHGTSLILCGGPGTGKTHLATAVGNVVIRYFGRRVRYITTLSLIRDVKSTWAAGSAKTESQVIGEFSEVDLLILDEVGVQYGSPSEKIIIFDVLNRRYEGVRPTIAITNLALPETTQFLGDRVMDRFLEGGGAILAFQWGSYRNSVLSDEKLSWPTVSEIKLPS